MCMIKSRITSEAFVTKPFMKGRNAHYTFKESMRKN